MLGIAIMYGKAVYYNIHDWFGWDETLQTQNVQVRVDTKPSRSQEESIDLSAWAKRLDTYMDQLSDNDARSRARISSTLHSFELEEYARKQFSPNRFSFSLLPPGKWLVVPAIGVRAPIVDLAYAPSDKMERGDFYTELEQGVVKYPYTAEPGHLGNTVIFGHSSTELWDKNKYGNIFQKISKLNDNDEIQVLRDGQVFSYNVQKKIITSPKDVAQELNQYKKGKFLTLMACYPLFSDLERIMIIAENKTSVSPQLSKM